MAMLYDMDNPIFSIGEQVIFKAFYFINVGIIKRIWYDDIDKSWKYIVKINKYGVNFVKSERQIRKF